MTPRSDGRGPAAGMESGARDGTEHRTDRPVLVGGLLVGAGVAALLDVALFHHVLQWHHLLSSVYAPTTEAGLRRNLFFDGVFSLAMLGVALAGAAVLWRAANGSRDPHSNAWLVGSVLAGAGAFNVLDGVVDHYLLGVHDVVHGTAALYPHWVGVSLLLVGAGLIVLALAR